MGLISRGTLTGVLLLGVVVCPAAAAPKLRLSDAALGPVSSAQGSNGPSRTIEAYNAGDGALSLTVSSSVAWLAGSVGAQRGCSLPRTGSCIPITVALNTASLARGAYTGTLTVSDPNALDAPQTVTVTAAVGGTLPDRLDLFAAPNGASAELGFTTNTSVQARAATDSGGAWLSVALDGVGTFRFPLPYKIVARPAEGMAEGTYRGSIIVSGSGVAADNKTVPVSMQVTSQPIAQAAPQSLVLRYAQNIGKQRANISIANRGLGTLAISGATASTVSGGSWLAAEPVAGYPVVQAVIDTTNVAPGTYQGTVAIATNAANATINVPVTIEVLAQGPPRALAQGVRNNATFELGDPVAPGTIAAIFGEQFTLKDPKSGSLPLTDTVDGVRVLVNDQAAPIYYVSYGQINFQIPYETPAGDAVVRVEREGQRGNGVSLSVEPAAPRLLRLGIGNYGIVVNQDGSFPIPATPGIASRPAKEGEALVIYAIGFGQTTPAASTGVQAAADPLARIQPPYTVYFSSGFAINNLPTEPLFIGLTPGFVGLYQINVIVPPEAPKGDHVRLTVQRDSVVSNPVELSIQ